MQVELNSEFLCVGVGGCGVKVFDEITEWELAWNELK